MSSESHAESEPGSVPLTDPKREAFAQDLVAGYELYDAYVAAGFKRPRGNANRMLAEADVQARVRFLFAKCAELAQVCGARRLLEQEKIAYANMLDYWDVDTKTGNLKRLRLNKITRAQGAAIKSIGYDASGRPKIELFDKVSMLKHLDDRLAPMPKRVEMTGKDGEALVPPQSGSDIDLARRLAYLLQNGERALAEGAK